MQPRPGQGPRRRVVVRRVTVIRRVPPTAAQPRQPPTAGHRPPAHRPPARNGGAIGAVVLAIIGVVLAITFSTTSSGTSPHPKSSGGSGRLPAVSIAGAWTCTTEPPALTAPNAPSTDQRVKDCVSAKHYAKQLLTAKYGPQSATKSYTYSVDTPADQFNCLDQLWTGESRWDDWAKNPNSWANGIPQYDLPTGQPYRYGDWKGQIDWGLGYYIPTRYTRPCLAYQFWLNQNPHWY